MSPPECIPDLQMYQFKQLLNVYYIKKTMEISASHRLELAYPSKCTRLHGHNWTITVYCMAEQLNADGMVCDFSHIKETVAARLDHADLNEVLGFNPTAENIARWVVDNVPFCYRADIMESSGNMAVYVKDGVNAPVI